MSVEHTNKPDVSVKLPEAVRRGAERANELAEQQRQGRMAIVDVNSPTPPIAPKPEPTPAPAPAPAPAPTPVTPKSNGDRPYTEHDFHSLKGRYDKAEQEKRDLINRVNELQRTLAVVQTPSPTAPLSAPGRRLIKDEEVKEYSPEFFDMIGRRAREIAEPEVAALRAEIAQLRQGLGGVQQNVVLTAQERMYQELEKEVPDWDTQRVDPGFNGWLQHPDPISGIPRQVLLTDAYKTGQTSRVVAAFKGYKQEQAALNPTSDRERRGSNGGENSQGNSDNASSNYSGSKPPTTSPAVDLASLAAPGRARSGQQPTSPDKPIITRDEIREFYANITKGLFVGKDDVVKQVEQQIAEASREGRIR